jgi:hypothetical protein
MGIGDSDNRNNYNKWQISAYQMIRKALDFGFSNASLPEAAFSHCVGCSNIYYLIRRAESEGRDLSKGGKIAIYCTVNADYRLR